MSRKSVRRIAAVIVGILVIALVVTSIPVFFIGEKNENVYFGGLVAYAAEPTGSTSGKMSDAELEEELENLAEVIRYIETHYLDEVTTEELLQGAYEGVFAALKDPYSVYYETEEARDEFLTDANGQYSGVGIHLMVEQGVCSIVTPMAGSPAERAGLQSGDVIIKVDGISIVGFSSDQVTEKIRGAIGTNVSITILRKRSEMSFTLTRELIQIASVESEMLDGKIAYIRISHFDLDSDKEFRTALNALLADGAKGLVVDIRNNPGGHISTAAGIAGYFMQQEAICHFERRGVDAGHLQANNNKVPEIPVTLLVNEGSASASEILAGAWKDSGAAILVGQTTYGKGVAQEVLTMENGHSFKLSNVYFLTPKKTKIHGAGITPDVKVLNYDGTGKEELEKTYAGFAPMSEAVKPKAGDVGLNVFGAQQRLSMLGYKVPVNAAMDAATVAAIKAFQTEKGLFSYGVLDYTTRNAIDEAAYAYVKGVSDEDLQLKKAIELSQ